MEYLPVQPLYLFTLCHLWHDAKLGKFSKWRMATGLNLAPVFYSAALLRNHFFHALVGFATKSSDHNGDRLAHFTSVPSDGRPAYFGRIVFELGLRPLASPGTGDYLLRTFLSLANISCRPPRVCHYDRHPGPRKMIWVPSWP